MVEEQNSYFMTNDQFALYLGQKFPCNKGSKSAANILEGFFEFYSEQFDPRYNCIDISQALSLEDLSSSPPT